MIEKNSYPVAVLISDIHYTVSTLDLASASLVKAQYKAHQLGVPLVICGDTLDSKAIMRAECVNRLLGNLAVEDSPKTYILTGNHDLINEKGSDHSLKFLWNWNKVVVVDMPTEVRLHGLSVMLIPYQSDFTTLRSLLNNSNTPKTLIMHQGLAGADMGHYVQDKSAITKEDVKNFRVISGHYHRRQDIKCGEVKEGLVGMFSYVGNPYSLGFGEANHPEKGFQILNSDGSLDFCPTGLRKHVVKDITLEDLKDNLSFNEQDLVWLKLHGKKNQIGWINKKNIKIDGPKDFKFDKFYSDTPTLEAVNKQSDKKLLDTLIDREIESDKERKYLKTYWRSLISEPTKV